MVLCPRDFVWGGISSLSYLSGRFKWNYAKTFTVYKLNGDGSRRPKTAKKWGGADLAYVLNLPEWPLPISLESELFLLR